MRPGCCLFEVWVSTPPLPLQHIASTSPLLTFICLPSLQWTVKSDWFHLCVLHMHEPCAAQSGGMNTHSPERTCGAPEQTHTQTLASVPTHTHNTISLVIHTYSYIQMSERGFHRYMKMYLTSLLLLWFLYSIFCCCGVVSQQCLVKYKSEMADKVQRNVDN